MSLFGLSGEVISLVIQIIGLVVSLAIGASGYKKSLIRVTLAIGIAVNFLGQFVFAGGGPGAFVGMFLLPLYCLAAGYIGRGLWWAVVGRNRKP